MNQNNIPFMPIEAGEDGLVAIGGTLSPDNLVKRYKNGIFPWFMERGVPFWFCPDPRLVLYPSDFKLSRSLKKSMKKFEFSVNQNFESIIKLCATSKRHNQNGTWINKEYIKSYTALHRLGMALSIEVWYQNELVGGLYGVYLAPIFFGESMFSRQTDASKAALAYLAHKSKELKITLIDCQQATPHLISLGAIEISKDKFLDILKQAFPLNAQAKS